MARRKSTVFLFYLGLLCGLFLLMFTHAFYNRKENGPALLQKREMVRRLGLTDLCLFTDARYTRHPSMADLNTAFQDYPMAFDYFPSGSILAPPPHLKGEIRQTGSRRLQPAIK